MYASCDAQYFQFHAGARDFFCAKPDASLRETSLEFWKMGQSSVGKRLARVKKAGEPWCWTYDSQKIKPEIWCVVDSAGAVQYVWEGESSVNPDAPGSNPIETTLEQGGSIIPSGGSAVKIQLPRYDDTGDFTLGLNTIETNVLAAAIPSWVTGTFFEQFTAVADLLEILFRQMQHSRRIRIYKNLTTLSAPIMDITTADHYTLLWLRAASMIINNHAAETAIPLIKTWTVDATTGQITV